MWRTNGTYRRTGEATSKMAIYGNSKTYYYRTPSTFFGKFDSVFTGHSKTKILYIVSRSVFFVSIT